jgi:hypothetical protein
MAYKKIIWSSRASNELKQILEYFNYRNKSTRYSLKLLNEIENLNKQTLHMAHIGYSL